MSRTVRDARIETRAARQKLLVRGKPYYRGIEPGLHIGYRKGKNGGKWVARIHIKDTQYRTKTIGIADDVSDADGDRVLSFGQAQEAARQLVASHHGDGLDAWGKPYTVSDALDAYLASLDPGKTTRRDFECRADAFIRPMLGNTEMGRLSFRQIRDWHQRLAAQPARIRTRVGQEQKYKGPPTTPEEVRKRRHSANKVLTILKAALNRAYEEGRATSDDAWRRVKPFPNVDHPRVRYLDKEQARTLVEKCDDDFGLLVQAALLTGCRYGELTRLQIADFDERSRSIHVQQSKSGKARKVYLQDEGIKFFKRLIRDRGSDERMFLRSDGTPWKEAHQARRTRSACEEAGITPPISFHALRHTYASHLVMDGVILKVVAENLGHSDTRMVEKHYTHLCPNYISEAIRNSGSIL